MLRFGASHWPSHCVRIYLVLHLHRLARQRLMAFESDIRPAARRALDAIEFAYARGASNLTDVLDARRTWHATELDLAVARADHAKAIAAWRAATLWEDENGTP